MPKSHFNREHSKCIREDGGRVHNGVEIGEILAQLFSAAILNVISYTTALISLTPSSDIFQVSPQASGFYVA